MMSKTLKDLSRIQDEPLPPPPARPRAPNGLKQGLFYNSIEAIRQLKITAAEQQTTISALIGEGMNMMFRKYGKPQIAIESPAKDKL